MTGSEPPGHSRGGQAKRPPLDFTYGCAHCGRTSSLIQGDPKSGLCAFCSATLVSPETLAAIGRACSENPPTRRPR